MMWTSETEYSDIPPALEYSVSVQWCRTSILYTLQYLPEVPIFNVGTDVLTGMIVRLVESELSLWQAMEASHIS
jgi:hypothetical protein